MLCAALNAKGLVAVNRTKVLEAAQKFLSKGQYDKAVAEYQKLVAEDPRDVRTLLKIGDLHTRRQKPKDAIDVYERVADLYAKQGFFLKAVAVYKQILKLDPAHLESTQKLAKMYEELALTSDALTTYEQVADTLMTQGNMPRALEIMERMIELDSHNVAVRIKYAEGLSKAGKPREAATAFAAGAQLLREQGRMDDYLRVVERQLYHDPESVSIARELAGLYLERSDPKRALAKLQICFKADPRDVQTLEMLAEAFRQLGQSAKTISVLKEIARLHAEAGSEEPRRRALRRVLDLDANDAEARQILASPAPVSTSPKSVEARPTAAPPRKASQTAQPAVTAPPVIQGQPVDEPAAEAVEEELELDPDAAEELELVEDDAEDDVLIVDEPDAASMPPPTNTLTAGDRVVALLADADAREGAGDYEGAVASLQSVLELEPEHVAAHERLKDIYIAADRRVDAVKELLWLSTACEEHSFDRAMQYAEAAYELAPRSEATRRRLLTLGGTLPDLGMEGRPASAGRGAPEPEQPDTELDVLQENPPSASMRGLGPSPSSEYAAELLDLPISPDEFDAPPPRPRRASVTAQDVSELLERPITPEEFDADTFESIESLRPAALESLHPEPIETEPPARGGQPPPAPALPPPSVNMPLGGERDFRDLPSMEFAPLEPSQAGPSDAVPDWTAREVSPTRAKPPEPFPPPRKVATRERALPPVPKFARPPIEPKREAPMPPIARAAPPPAPSEEMYDQTTPGEIPPDALLGRPAPAPAPELPPTPVPPKPTAAERLPPPPVVAPGKSGARVVTPAATPAEPPAPLPVEVEEVLDEADFFAQQSMFDEALEVVQEAILIYPGSAALKARLAEYEAKAEQRAQQRDESSDTGEGAQDDSFDIAEQLANDVVEVESAAENDDLDVESVFAQFKKGVAEQIAPDDSETHFDLGIAYKEMGLIGDAVNEFELAAKHKKRACTALTMIGTCHLERGNPKLAITYFERALNLEHHAPGEELALHYEIGNAYEQLGELDKALTSFEKVAARERSFRGVSGRLEQLKKRGVKPARASR